MYYRLTQKNREYIFLCFIILISAFLIALCIQEGHDWSGDYALYIEQAHALLNTSVNKLYALNKYSTDHAFRVQGPYLYPMGFPFLLTVPYYFFGMQFIALKVFCGIFFLLALPIFYRLFQPYFSHSFYSFCILIAIAFHYEYITFCNNVLSDLPFFFFSGVTFLQMRRENRISNQLLVGVLIFFSYYIRDVGIILLPTLMVYQFQLIFIEKKKEKNQWYYFLPYFIFVAFYLLNYVLFPKGNANHYDLFWSKLSWELILKNAIYYVRLFSSYFFIKNEFLLFLLFPLLVGIFSYWKKQLHFITYTILMLLIYLIWPAQQGMRFVFPILPFILYFIVKGLQVLSLFLKLRQRYLSILLASSLFFLIYQSIQRIVDFSNTDTNLAYNSETKLMYIYISENIPEKEVIGFAKPRVLRLFTGRNSILSDISHFDSSGLSYLLIRKEDIPSGRVISYKKVYETKKLILVRR